jgi:hypothetical protein
MNKARLEIAGPDIRHFFDELPSKVLRISDISRHLSEQRQFWRLAQSTTLSAFIAYLTQSGKLSKMVFPFPPPYKKEIRYAWGDVPFHQVLLSLKKDCYFCHYTAMKAHGLTEQIPKTIYLNDEQRLESWLSGRLSQKSIDAAFRRPVRVSGNVAETKDFRVCIINGKNTGKLGVIEMDVNSDKDKSMGSWRLTNIERTLIDITVRPIYAGGVTEVLKAFELAKEKVSVNRLAAMLHKLRYIYPFHQAIGFYLERAGYKPSLLEIFQSLPQEFDFYLAHDMRTTDYVENWRLFIPQGF